MNLLRSIALSIVASLGLMAIPATARAQAIGEKTVPLRTHRQELTPQRCRKKPLRARRGFTPTKTTATS